MKLPSWYLIHTGYSVTRHKNHKNGELTLFSKKGSKLLDEDLIKNIKDVYDENIEYLDGINIINYNIIAFILSIIAVIISIIALFV